MHGHLWGSRQRCCYSWRWSQTITKSHEVLHRLQLSWIMWRVIPTHDLVSQKFPSTHWIKLSQLKFKMILSRKEGSFVLLSKEKEVKKKLKGGEGSGFLLSKFHKIKAIRESSKGKDLVVTTQSMRIADERLKGFERVWRRVWRKILVAVEVTKFWDERCDDEIKKKVLEAAISLSPPPPSLLRFLWVDIIPLLSILLGVIEQSSCDFFFFFFWFWNWFFLLFSIQQEFFGK